MRRNMQRRIKARRRIAREPAQIVGSHLGEIVLYSSADGSVTLDVRLDKETIWLNLNQLASLFERDKSVISRHLRNVFESNELEREATVAIFATVQEEGERKVVRDVEYFNLDAIISVGYRVNSMRGTQFRIWATDVLRKHLLEGYTENRRRLAQLRKSVRLISAIGERRALSGDEAASLLALVGEYEKSLDLLDDYDHQRISAPAATGRVIHALTADEARRIVGQLRTRFGDSTLFGVEKDKGLESALGAVMQTFGGSDLYPALEQKAAHLLYFLVKNHAFVDGNKRIAAALFLWFLDRNHALTRTAGERVVSDATLVALTLMIAASRPAEKDAVVNIVAHLLCE